MADFLAVIPARAGSTRLPGKNLRTIAGKTLVRLALECALAVPALREVIVSSDSSSILEEAMRAAQWSPRVTLHHRDEEIATATAKIEPLLSLLMDSRPQATHCVLLNPTSPLRDPATIERCLTAITNLGADCVATVYRSSVPAYAWRRSGDDAPWLPPFTGPSRPRSQDLAPSLIEHGACYVVSRRALEEGQLFAGSCMPIVTDRVEATDVDDEVDLVVARALFDVYVTGHGVVP